MPKVTDYYELLRVRRDATPEEISRAHRLMARKTHPDITGVDDGVFSQINVAYDTLIDEAKRAAYDLDLRQSEAPTQEAPPAPQPTFPQGSSIPFTVPTQAQPMPAPGAPIVGKYTPKVAEAPVDNTSAAPVNIYTTQEKIINSVIFMVLGFLGFILIGRFTGMSGADASSSTYAWFLSAGVLAIPALLFRNKATISLAIFSLTVGAMFGMLSGMIAPGFTFFQALWASAAWYGIFYSAKKPTFFS